MKQALNSYIKELNNRFFKHECYYKRSDLIKSGVLDKDFINYSNIKLTETDKFQLLRCAKCGKIFN